MCFNIKIYKKQYYVRKHVEIDCAPSHVYNVLSINYFKNTLASFLKNKFEYGYKIDQ